MEYQTLNLLFRCGKEFSHEKIRRQELSDTECMICSYIHSHENCSQDDVSAALKTDKTTVGKALASLERKKCVSRTQDPADKRIKKDYDDGILEFARTFHPGLLVPMHMWGRYEIPEELSEKIPGQKIFLIQKRGDKWTGGNEL